MPENDQPPADQPQPESQLPYQDDLKGKRLERRALRSRWNVPDKYREALMKRVVRDGLDSSASKRDCVSAMRAILQADQQDYEKDKAEAGIPDVVEHRGEVTTIQKQEQDVRAKLTGFIEQYDATMARATGLSSGVLPGDYQSVDEAGTNGQADDLSGNGQH